MPGRGGSVVLGGPWCGGVCGGGSVLWGIHVVGGGSSTTMTITTQMWLSEADSTYSRARPKKQVPNSIPQQTVHWWTTSCLASWLRGQKWTNRPPEGGSPIQKPIFSIFRVQRSLKSVELNWNPKKITRKPLLTTTDLLDHKLSKKLNSGPGHFDWWEMFLFHSNNSRTGVFVD